MEIFLTRGSDGDGTWLTLPYKDSYVEAAYERLDELGLEHMETRIGGVNSSVRSLDSVLLGKSYDDPQIRREVDFLSKRIDCLLEWQRDLYSARLGKLDSASMQDIINTSYYQNFEPFRTEENVYDGERLPDPAYEKDTILLLRLLNKAPSKWRSTTLSLPATEERLDETKKRLQIVDFSGCQIRSYDELWDYLPVSCQDGEHLESLNRLLTTMKDKGIAPAEFMAVLEAECPRTMEDVERAFENTENTCLYSEIDDNTPEAFARAFLREGGLEYLIPHINYDSYAPALMKECHAVQTKQGVLTINQRVCEALPDELVTTRLFSPLSGLLYRWDDWGTRDEGIALDADDLTDYADSIEQAVKNEDWSAAGHRGLANYLDNRLLRQRVISMFPSVEQYEEKMWGVMEIQTRGELLREELAEVTEEWAGQASDGWGEGFEQKDISVDGGILRVSFWNSDPSFKIVTEQALKDYQEPGMQINGM